MGSLKGKDKPDAIHSGNGLNFMKQIPMPECLSGF